MEIFDVKKLKNVDVKEMYEVKTTNMFTALGSLAVNMDINRAWENIMQNIKTF
jgi:hypothetical protein